MRAGVKDVCRAQTERSEDLGVPALMKRQKEESTQDLKECVGGCSAGNPSRTYL